MAVLRGLPHLFLNAAANVLFFVSVKKKSNV